MRVILFFLVVLPCAGFSALQWIKRYIFNRASMNAQDRMRVEHAFGIIDPDMDLWWHQFFHGDGTSAAWSFELAKNVASEWCKLDAQRAVKFLSLIILFWVTVSLMLGITIAILEVT